MNSLIHKIKNNTTVKNFGLVVASRFFSAGLYMIFTFLLMDFMSTKQFGQYSYLYALAGYVPFYVTLGINKSFTAFTSNLTNENEYKNYLGLFWKTKIVLSLIMLGVIIAHYLFVGIFVEFVVLLCGLTFGFTESFKSPAESRKKFDYVALVVPIRNVLLVAITFSLFWIDKPSIKNVVVSLLAANVLNLVVTGILYLRKIGPFEYSSTLPFSTLFNHTKWIFVKEFLLNNLARIEIFALTYFITTGQIAEEERAYFSGAFTLCFVLPIITNSLTKVLLPEVATLKASKSLKFYLSKIKRSLKLSIPIAVAFYLTIYLVVNFYFRSKYQNSLPLFPCIILATLISFYSNNIALIFYREGKVQFIGIQAIIQFIVGLIGCITLIPLYGAMGAVISLLIVRVVGFVLVLSKTKKSLYGKAEFN